MAIKKISEFTSTTPTASDKILIEQSGAGRSTTIGNAVNTCSLTYEQIQASTDLEGKVASAKALKTALQTIGVPNHPQRVLIYNGKASYEFQYTVPSNGLITCSGYGTQQSNSYITYQLSEDYIFGAQGVEDERIYCTIPVAKGDVVIIRVYLANKNDGLYFIPYK